jgi:hypothetical protein
MRRCGRKLPHFAHCTQRILPTEAVDNVAATSLYKSSWRAAAWRDGASWKPLTVYAVNHPACALAMSDVRASAASLSVLAPARGKGKTEPQGSGMFDK